MSKRSKSLVGAAWAAVVMVALVFGATQAMAAPISMCPGATVGFCPPFTMQTCNQECLDLGWVNGGGCVRGCCICLI